MGDHLGDSLKHFGTMSPEMYRDYRRTLNEAPVMEEGVAFGAVVRLIVGKIPDALRKFCNINETLKRVIGILVYWHISTGILTRIGQAILVKIPVKMYPLTRIPMTRLNVSFMSQNFPKCDWQVRFIDGLVTLACNTKNPRTSLPKFKYACRYKFHQFNFF